MIILVSGDSPLFPFLLHDVPASIHNVCFKDTSPQLLSIPRLKQCLAQYEITFKICTIILRSSLISQANLQYDVVQFVNKFDLEACVAKTMESQAFHGYDSVTFRTTVDEWISIVS